MSTIFELLFHIILFEVSLSAISNKDVDHKQNIIEDWANCWLEEMSHSLDSNQTKDAPIMKEVYNIGPYRSIKKFCALNGDERFCMDVSLHNPPKNSKNTFPSKIHIYRAEEEPKAAKSRLRRDADYEEDDLDNEAENEESEYEPVNETGNDEDNELDYENIDDIRAKRGNPDDEGNDNDLYEEDYEYYEGDGEEDDDEEEEELYEEHNIQQRSHEVATLPPPPDWSRCRLPPALTTAEVYCKNTPDKIHCYIYCIHGHAFSEGVLRETDCRMSVGTWTKPIEECKPFVDCTLKLRTAGFLKCHSHGVRKVPECDISCERFAVHGTTPLQNYKCSSVGLWSPPLPHCVGNEGIELIEAPKEREINEILYPK